MTLTPLLLSFVFIRMSLSVGHPFKVVIIKVVVGVQGLAILFLAVIAVHHSYKIAEVSELCFSFPSFFCMRNVFKACS